MTGTCNVCGCPGERHLWEMGHEVDWPGAKASKPIVIITCKDCRVVCSQQQTENVYGYVVPVPLADEPGGMP